MNAKDRWAEQVDDAQNAVESVISFALQAYLSENGGYDPSKPHATPQAREVMFYWHMFVMDVPDYVEFTGTSTDGEFKGKYYPKTGEVKADVDVGGMGLEGVGAVRKAGEKIQVAGKLVNGQAQATVNGKQAKIVFPEKSDDDR
jgi:hypothetical protein